MAIEDHFEHLPLGGGPMLDGHLSQFDYDPTHGGTSIHESKPIYRCTTCGAAVLNPARHAEWHDGPPDVDMNEIDPLGQG